jgi:hypothetical protein
MKSKSMVEQFATTNDIDFLSDRPMPAVKKIIANDKTYPSYFILAIPSSSDVCRYT